MSRITHTSGAYHGVGLHRIGLSGAAILGAALVSLAYVGLGGVPKVRTEAGKSLESLARRDEGVCWWQATEKQQRQCFQRQRCRREDFRDTP